MSVDYQRYLGQSDMWPSESKDTVKIYSMAHGHAVNALHKLIEWGKEDDRWGQQPEMHLRRTPLAMALLKQAVGEPVIYAEDLPEAPLERFDKVVAEHDDSIAVRIDLEDCYDALVKVSEYDNATPIPHPVTRARVLFRALATLT